MKASWIALAEAMVAEGVYNPSRLTPRHLSSAYHRGRAIVLWNTESTWHGPWKALAYGSRLKTKDPLWEEIAQLYVTPPLRRNGLMADVVKKLIGQTVPEKCFFAITKETSVMATLRRLNFMEMPLEATPEVIAFAERLGISERLPKDGEARRLFTRQP